jgi:hypothetical protein
MILFFLKLLQRRLVEFVIARSVLRIKYVSTRLSVFLAGNERQSNLLSLINWQGVFKHHGENPFTLNQSVEIARESSTGGIISLWRSWCCINGILRPVEDSSSGMRQSTFNTFLTELRNDAVWCEGRKSQSLQKSFKDFYLATEGNLYA